MTSARRAVRLCAAVALITAIAAGCAASGSTATASFSTRAGGTGTAAADTPPPAIPTPSGFRAATAPVSAASAAATAAAVTATPSAPPRPQLSASGGTMQFVHHPGDPFAATATAAVGTVLQVRLEPAPGYRWTTVTSTDSQIAQVTASSVEPSGIATATITLRAPGAASLTATTSYQPDPHGPPTRLWRLTLTVTP